MPEPTLDEAGALAPLITPQDGIAQVAAGAVLIDVRGAASQERDGALPGAIPVDRNNVEAEFSFESALRHPQVVSFDTPIVVVCGSVRGSGPVAAELREQGFTNVSHVEGGFGAYVATTDGAPPPAVDETCDVPAQA
jgi:rhodanese-related sulfurtransferase